MWRKRDQGDALLQAEIGAFALVSSAAFSAPELTGLLIRRLPEMIDIAQRIRRPFVLQAPDRGKIGPFPS